MNLLKSKKVDRPQRSKKTLDCETEGNDLDEAYEEETKEDDDEWVEKKRKNLSPRGSSYKSRKRKEVDYKIEIGTKEESVEEKGKKTKGKKGSYRILGEKQKP